MTETARKQMMDSLPYTRRCPFCDGRTELLFAERITKRRKKKDTDKFGQLLSARPMIYCWRCKAIVIYRALVHEADAPAVVERYNSRLTDREEALKRAKELSESKRAGSQPLNTTDTGGTGTPESGADREEQSVGGGAETN